MKLEHACIRSLVCVELIGSALRTDFDTTFYASPAAAEISWGESSQCLSASMTMFRMSLNREKEVRSFEQTIDRS